MCLQERQVVADKSEMLFGTALGDSAIKGNEDEGVGPDELGTRMVEHGECVSVNGCLQLSASQSYKPFYTADEVRAFRSLGLETGMIQAFATAPTSDVFQGIQLLGFKNYSELLFEDNVKHSAFIYPDEDVGPNQMKVHLPA